MRDDSIIAYQHYRTCKAKNKHFEGKIDAYKTSTQAKRKTFFGFHTQSNPVKSELKGNTLEDNIRICKTEIEALQEELSHLNNEQIIELIIGLKNLRLSTGK